MFSKQHIATRIKCYGENLQDLLHFSRPQLSREEAGIIRKLKRDGYAIVEGFLTQKECDQLKTDVDEAILKHSKNTWHDEQKSDHRVFGIERTSQAIKEFYSDKHLQKLGEAYLATTLDNYMTLGARLEATENNLGSGGGWHRDSTYEHQFKSIAYLTDVNDDNGPFQFVKESHKTNSVLSTVGIGKNNNRYTHDEIEKFVSSNNLEIETLTGKKGTVILVDTKGLHRGQPINSGIRYALTNYYISSYKKHRFHSYFKDLVIKD